MAELLNIKRIQHPVGHGGFHTCEMGLGQNKSSKYVYVYDCGAYNGKKLIKKRIDDFMASHKSIKKINALFISHLDRDHRNGIEYLLSKEASIEKIHLPYLDEINSIIHLFTISGEYDDKMIEAVLYTQKYFNKIAKEKGIESPKIIRVRGEKMDEDEHDISDKGKVIRHNEKIEPPLPGKNIDWILVPHVTDAGIKKMKDFKKEFKNEFGINDTSNIGKKKMRELFSTENVIKMKRIYANHIAKQHNLISMSLYSGPSDKSRAKFSYKMCRGYKKDEKCIFSKLSLISSNLDSCQAVGWIGTGDADLKKPNLLKAFWNGYSNFTKFVIALHLPHHGSKNSSGKELLNSKKFPHLKFGIFNAPEISKDHPSLDILRNVLIARILPLQVSEEKNSIIKECICQES